MIDPKNLSPCSLCGCIHHAYVYSKSHSRVVNCTNCGLLSDIDFLSHTGDVFNYSAETIAQMNNLLKDSRETITLITTLGGNKSLKGIIEKALGVYSHRLKIVDFEMLNTYTGGDGSVIVDDHLLDQIDPLEKLRLLRNSMSENQTVVFLVELIGGNHQWLRESLRLRDMPARFWPDWTLFHKILLASGFDRIWLNDPESRQQRAQMSIVSARKGTKRESCLVSVIMPVFNESRTFNEAINRILKKNCRC